jgi:hypothetical protein
VGAPGVIRQPIDSVGRLFVVGLAATFTIAHRLSIFFRVIGGSAEGRRAGAHSWSLRGDRAMISFWATQANSFTIRNYCRNRGRTIADRFQIHIYDEIGEVVQFPGATQIFSDIDLISNSQRDIVRMIWDAHARKVPGVPRLNNARNVLLRFQLLNTLYERGINAFRVFRATDAGALDRFPVFVREMNSHNGPLTDLLNTRGEVFAALCALPLRGYRLGDLMIEEFCDTSTADGLFRKYSAFKVGGSIIPFHLYLSRQWCVKAAGNQPTEAHIREEDAYLEDNPHEGWLRRVFAIAGTDYGRIDYGVLNGVPQVWEINLNPSFGRRMEGQPHMSLAPHLSKLREAGREVAHTRLRNAFLALDTAIDSPVTVAVEPVLLTRVRNEAARRQRRQWVFDRLRWVYRRFRRVSAQPAR